MQTESLKRKAFEHFQRGQLKKAQSLYEKACRANNDDAEALYMLGSTYGQSGNYKRACSILEKALEKQPDALPIHCALGAAYKALGKTDDAITRFRYAMQLSPENSDIKLELAGLLMEKGNLPEAESLLNEVNKKSGSDPTRATALHGLGEIRHIERKIDEAINYYRQALKSDPQRPTTHNRLGHALHTLGRLDEAISHYHTAISQSPDFSTAYKNLAGSLLTAGRLDEATQVIDKALTLEPTQTDALICKASILEHKNDPEAAYDLIFPLLENGIKHPGLAIIFSDICNKVGACDKAASYLETLLEETALPDSTQEQLLYAAGKLYDKLGSFDKAFSCFENANNLRRDTYSSAEHTGTIQAFMETFDANFIATAPRAAHGSRRPIFIVGMPRSGTSLTEQILARHTEVAAAGELMEIENQAKIIHANSTNNRIFPRGFSSITSNTIAAAAENYLEYLNKFSNREAYVTDKMPQNFIFLGLINLLFPGARVIHCVRDPRDVCLSIFFQHFSSSHSYATRLEHIADYYLAYQRMMAHWKSVLDIPILDLRYEDLILEQENTTRQILDFLELGWEPRCLAFHESNRHVATSSYDQVRQPLYSKSMGRWRHYRKHIAPLLEVFGESELA